jgi:hypothetical protein
LAIVIPITGIVDRKTGKIVPIKLADEVVEGLAWHHLQAVDGSIITPTLMSVPLAPIT